MEARWVPPVSKRMISSSVDSSTRTKVSESVRVDGLDARYRFLQVTLSDEDNPPLQVVRDRIKVLRREVSLVFDAKPGQGYRLVTGNAAASAPRFDLGRSVKRVDETDHPMVRPGALTPLALEPEALPWTERHQALIWPVLVVAVGLMLLLILSNLGKLKRGDTAS